MAAAPFQGQRTEMSREEAIESYISLRLCTEDLMRLGFLVEGLHAGTIQLHTESRFTHADLKDTARTAFFGWFAKLTDKDGRAVYAFDPLFVLFPSRRAQITAVQQQCEKCHRVLQQFRGNVAFHSRAQIQAQIQARQALRDSATFQALEFARVNVQQLMTDLIAEEFSVIPELPERIAQFGVAHHPAFRNMPVAVPAQPARESAFLSCEILD
jgi:hypothetical protein